MGVWLFVYTTRYQCDSRLPLSACNLLYWHNKSVPHSCLWFNRNEECFFSGCHFPYIGMECYKWSTRRVKKNSIAIKSSKYATIFTRTHSQHRKQPNKRWLFTSWINVVSSPNTPYTSSLMAFLLCSSSATLFVFSVVVVVVVVAFCVYFWAKPANKKSNQFKMNAIRIKIYTISTPMFLLSLFSNDFRCLCWVFFLCLSYFFLLLEFWL